MCPPIFPSVPLIRTSHESIIEMAKKRKQVVINGKTYEVRKDRKYQNINNPQDVISRRQAEKAALQSQGFKSFEEKAKVRKKQGIPKGYRQNKLTPHSTRKSYHKTVETLTELQEEIENLPDGTILYVVAKVTKHYPHAVRQAGESVKAFNQRKNLKLFRPISSFGTPEYHLKYFKLMRKKHQQIIHEGYQVDGYEIRFTFL